MFTIQLRNERPFGCKYLVTGMLVLILLTGITSTAIAQQKYTDTLLTRGKTFAEALNHSDVVLTDVKYKPEFPGGKAAWVTHLRANIDLTIPAKKKAPDGVHYASVLFIVGKDGSLRSIRAESGCGYGMEDELIKSLKGSPTWIPAQTSVKEAVSFAARQLVIYTIRGTSVTIKIP